MTNDFAVIKLNSRQFIVKQGTVLKVDVLPETPLFEVLLAEVDGQIHIGEPTLDAIGVKIQIVEDKKDKKIEVRRFKSKSRYRKNKGHRQPVSMLKVLEIGDKIKNELFREDVVSESPVKEMKKKVAEVKAEKVLSIDDLDITDKQKETLKSAGYKTVADIKSANKEDLLNLKGFGEKSVLKLSELVS
ncbi:50S ribosomal protein L21 [candidate division WWE3 bacterium CG_4_9_14_0_2_um_filter_35_11]|uniref:Large ribosomal subunit protein bL21 n=1 Tax=candidate division WWE3 bacterium CG_4_9_14_0_2_um_filter_35_11 TaxID=1975077 RepID=A0A2M8EMC7_UNCKA|nr:MAG: 50S ribosomal protein L21 [candidate division WWE3 bacterium CG10_big_fil_rev_8_21_14_0_10_35_32]PJC23879.1 MAG: 50S ribosomal protein L21 [candidate division WWE3 bacterium CG_4_9_14_0_2_um_filter_35_11]